MISSHAGHAGWGLLFNVSGVIIIAFYGGERDIRARFGPCTQLSAARQLREQGRAQLQPQPASQPNSFSALSGNARAQCSG